MSTPTCSTWVILNPAAGQGRAASQWPALAAQLRQQIGCFTQAVTCGPGDATFLTQQALAAGASRLLVAGGDGTLNEVVNGLVGADTTPTLALLPVGTGADFAHAQGIRSVSEALMLLHTGTPKLFDLAVASFSNQSGQQEQRAFINVADCGLGPLASAAMQEQRHLGRAAYLYGAFQAIVAYAPAATTITVDGEAAWTAPSGLLAVANSSYFGGGMQIAPKARADDGLLDLVMLGATNRRTLITQLLPQVYLGRHLRHPHVHLLRGRTITISTDPPLPLELDGEIVGSTPATFALAARQVRVLVPPTPALLTKNP